MLKVRHEGRLYSRNNKPVEPYHIRGHQRPPQTSKGVCPLIGGDTSVRTGGCEKKFREPVRLLSLSLAPYTFLRWLEIQIDTFQLHIVIVPSPPSNNIFVEQWALAVSNGHQALLPGAHQFVPTYSIYCGNNFLSFIQVTIKCCGEFTTGSSLRVN